MYCHHWTMERSLHLVTNSGANKDVGSASFLVCGEAKKKSVEVQLMQLVFAETLYSI